MDCIFCRKDIKEGQSIEFDGNYFVHSICQKKKDNKVDETQEIVDKTIELMLKETGVLPSYYGGINTDYYKHFFGTITKEEFDYVVSNKIKINAWFEAGQLRQDDYKGFNPETHNWEYGFVNKRICQWENIHSIDVDDTWDEFAGTFAEDDSVSCITAYADCSCGHFKRSKIYLFASIPEVINKAISMGLVKL